MISESMVHYSQWLNRQLSLIPGLTVDVATHLRGDEKRKVRGREFAWAMDDIYFEGEWRGVQTRFARNTPDLILHPNLRPEKSLRAGRSEWSVSESHPEKTPSCSCCSPQC
ncbi:hypothetical protein EMIT0P265_90178 [Pseudomonas zeae]